MTTQELANDLNAQDSLIKRGCIKERCSACNGSGVLNDSIYPVDICPKCKGGTVQWKAPGVSYGEAEYCGCCGREADAGEWCSDCKEHVDPRKTLWDATYLAQHGEHCPFQSEDTRLQL